MIMLRGRSRKWLLAPALGIVILMLACGVLGVLSQQRRVLTQQEIEQRAQQIARNEYGGTISNIAVQQVTRGQMGAAFCSSTQRLLVPAVSLLLNDWNHCDPDIPMWQIKLDGKFHWHMQGNVIRDLELTLWPDGTLQSASGEIVSEEASE